VTGRTLPPGRYRFDEVAEGDRIITGSVTVTATLIDAFADLSGDRFEIHMDEAAAAALGFSGRVAHGLLVLSLVDGLKNAALATFEAVASLGWDWSFRRPVLAGDTVAAEITVLERRPVSNSARGILRLGFTVKNGRGETVQEGTNLLMVVR
jgi:acyl dehydratase